MRGFAFHVAEIGVAYRENVAEVKQAMLDAFGELRDTEHGSAILGDFEMHGVTTFGDSAAVVRGRIKTLPGSQWAAGRAYNEIIKKVFAERGLELLYPPRTIYWGEDKNGEVSPRRTMQYRAAGKDREPQ